MTYEQLRDALREAIGVAWGGPGCYCWVRDFDDSFVWFELENGGGCTDYQVSYTATADGVTLGADRVEVEGVTTWVPATKIDINAEFDAVRKDDAQQLIFGWANVSVRKDGTLVVDSDGESIPIEDLEAAAYQFTLKYRATGEDHTGEQRGELIESVVFTVEKIAAMGLPAGALPLGWWVGFHIDDRADYEKIAKGEKVMFSVQGRAIAEPVGVGA